jgi:RND family efflux transporter MFP subunit
VVVDTGNSHADSAATTGSTLWDTLAQARTIDAYGPAWLALQASLIPDALQAVLVLKDETSASFAPVARWSDGASRDPERLADIAERCLSEKNGLLAELPPEAPGRQVRSFGAASFGAAYPLLIDGLIHGAVACELAPRDEAAIRGATAQLQWGMFSLELFFRRRSTEEQAAVVSRLGSSVDLLASVLGEEEFNEACMIFVTGVARQLRCDRVSLGLVKRSGIRIQAISHSANFDKRMSFIQSLTMAMDEAILQGAEIVFPSPAKHIALVTRHHEDLVRRFGMAHVLTVPLYGGDRYFGALTLERNGDDPFTPGDIEVCKSVFALAAPALAGKRIESLGLVHHVWESCRFVARRLLGAGHLGWKTAAILLCAVVIFFAVAEGDRKVTARATLEGSVRRTIAAPLKGYVKEAFARHGDTVREGTILCRLDERDLRLDKTNLLSQQNQLVRQRQEAVATHDRAKANVVQAQMDQVAAQIDLASVKLERTTIRAPFDGVLLSGDLSQKLGAVVEQGEVLFEISPLSTYRLTLMIDESDIAYIKEGQKGTVVLSALPDHYDVAIKKITPVTATYEGINTFRVEASLDGPVRNLRPGMEGIGKITVDHGRLISIWTVKLRNWLRLKAWAWVP